MAAMEQRTDPDGSERGTGGAFDGFIFNKVERQGVDGVPIFFNDRSSSAGTNRQSSRINLNFSRQQSMIKVEEGPCIQDKDLVDLYGGGNDSGQLIESSESLRTSLQMDNTGDDIEY